MPFKLLDSPPLLVMNFLRGKSEGGYLEGLILSSGGHCGLSSQLETLMVGVACVYAYTSYFPDSRVPFAPKIRLYDRMERGIQASCVYLHITIHAFIIY